MDDIIVYIDGVNKKELNKKKEKKFLNKKEKNFYE